MRASIEFVVAKVKSDPNAVFAGSVPYLKLAGIVLSGWQMARALIAASEKRAEDDVLRRQDRDRAVFRGACAVEAPGIEASIVSASGDQGMLAMREDQF